MEIYLVRHTTPDVPHGVCYGRQDVGLADSFEREANAVLDKLLQFTVAGRDSNSAGPSFEVTQVFCSPLHRCERLARSLTATAPRIEQRLVEMDFGRWEMQRWDQIPPEQLAAWERDPVHFAPLSRVIQSAPSSEPAQRTSGFLGDSAIAVAVPRFDLEISGEMARASAPCFTLRKIFSPPT